MGALPGPGDPGGHVAANRRFWDAYAPEWVAAGERHWAAGLPSWGIWGIPDADLALLPQRMAGARALELGCGTGYVSGWMARRGARVTGIDNAAAQLASARRLARTHGVALALVHGDAESLPFPDAAFDFAISEYGAATWCDPGRWLPEAARVLGPGGALVFLATHPLACLCIPADGDVCDTRLHRPYFGLHRLDWRDVPVDPGGVEFNLPMSEWLRLFRETGFAVEDYRELAAPAAAVEERFGVTAEWARQWPAEQAWWLRKAMP